MSFPPASLAFDVQVLAGTARDKSTGVLFQSKLVFPSERTNLTTLDLHLHPGWPFHRRTEGGWEGRRVAQRVVGSSSRENPMKSDNQSHVLSKCSSDLFWGTWFLML